jgi:inorganic pyrophosphatase
VYPIGVLKMIDSDQVDEKIIAIPFGDPSHTQYSDISELPGHLLTEMGHFFEVYKTLEGKKTYILDIEGHIAAQEVIQSSIDRYKKIFVYKK